MKQNSFYLLGKIICNYMKSSAGLATGVYNRLCEIFDQIALFQLPSGLFDLGFDINALGNCSCDDKRSLIR